MTKCITKNQAMFLLLICLIGTKFQRLPSFLSDVAGKGFWVVVLLYLVIDGFFLLLSLKIINMSNGLTLPELLEKTIGKFMTKVILALLGIYFFVTAILPYESVHEVFADIIFDSLPWKYFAFFLLVSMGAIAVSGLTNIGRMCQMFFPVIAFGVVGLFLLGATTTDLSQILPVTETVVSSVFEGFYKSTLWFGNFTILYILMGKIKDQGNKKWGRIKLSFFLSALFVAFSFVVFYGIYGNITPLKPNWLTKVSQFALLSLDIGRPDWFLILFAELATILTAGIFVFCSATCFKEVFKTKKINIIIYTILILLYLNTNFIFKSKLDIFSGIITIGPILGILVQNVLPFVLLICVHSHYRMNDKNLSPDKLNEQKTAKGAKV